MTIYPFPGSSPFAPIAAERIVYEDDDTMAFYDRYPLSPGHTLIVSKHVTASFFTLSPQQQATVWRAVAEIRRLLQERHAPDGFNVGLNDGPVAGQTMAHAHIHLIPRYQGDQPDPRGGIRWIFPEKAKYWP